MRGRLVLEEDVGTQIEITPSINLKTGEITMNIQPKITAQTSTVKDPATADSTKFKEQFSQGVSTWQASKLLWNTFNFGEDFQFLFFNINDH